MLSHTLAIGMPGLPELLIIGAIGLLVFGKRLPEVGRGLGQAIMQFKRGLHDASEEVTQVDAELDRRPALTNQTQTPVVATPVVTQAPKFDPYTGKPVEGAPAAEAAATPVTP